jgi:MHS family proline/betaine transporter-like MFS transporter
LITVIFLMTVATAGVGFLPGYATIGLLAPILLVLLRAAQGLAVGGELGASAVFILETAHNSRRGQAGSWQIATMAVGIGAGMGVASVLSYLVGDTGRWSGWWRIAFLLALPLGLVGLYLRRQVAETRPFVVLQTTSQVLDRPARQLWKRHKVALLRGFALVAAGSLAFNTFFIFMPNNLIARHGTDLSPTLLVTASTLIAAAVAAVTFGRMSDRVGRRPVVIGSCIALVATAIPATLLATWGSLLGLVLAQVVIGIAVVGVLSIAMLGEAFPAPVRSTGVALSAGIPTALIGGTAPWIAQILVTRTGAEAAPGVYIAVIGSVALLALWRWPETAFANLH